jgi:charged multivesicular body protein 2A
MQKFTQMRVQLQAVSLRMQTLRSNEQMASAMKGATRAMGQMNRSLNLPQVRYREMKADARSSGS